MRQTLAGVFLKRRHQIGRGILSVRSRDKPVVAKLKGKDVRDKLIRRPEVEALTGLSRSTIYEWMKRGDFPQPVKLGVRLVAWRQSDLLAWLESRETRGA